MRLLSCLFAGFAFSLLAVTIPRLPAMEIVFPADTHVIVDVKRDCGAKGDGVSDDSDALQNAIERCMDNESSRFIYLPKGVYKVTRTLICKPPGTGNNWGSMVGPWIYGQDRDATIIRLADGAEGFADPSKPKELLRGHWRPDGAKMNADFFDRTFVNFTLDTGTNKGAVGCKFYSNNTGVMRQMRIVGHGVCGIDLGWTDQNGPLLIQDVDIDGFSTGISSACLLNSQTLCRVTVRGADTVGFRLKGQMIAAEQLSVIDAPLAMDIDDALVSLTDCRFTRKNSADGKNISDGKNSAPAIRLGKGVLYVQNLKTTGYATAIAKADGEALAVGNDVAEFCSPAGEILGAGAGVTATGLNLTRTADPAIPWETDPAKWVCANDFGAVSGDDKDDSDAFQKAIDHAAAIKATTVYIRGGRGPDPNWYLMSKKVQVHGSVRHITGLGFVRILGGDPNKADFPAAIGGFVVEGADGPPLVAFSHMQVFGPPVFGITNRSPRTVLCDTTGASVSVGAGSTVFMTNCVGHMFQDKNSHVWIRQWNTEGNPGGTKTNTRNDGGYLWILGLKTEGAGCKVSTKNSGRTEILGVHNYNTTGITDDTPFFAVDDAAFSCSGYREICWGGGWWKVPVLVHEAGKEYRYPQKPWCTWTLLRTGN